MIGQRVTITQKLVGGVCDGQNYGPPTIAELQSLMGKQATIQEILRSGYAIEIDELEGLFSVYPDEVAL